MSDKIEIQLSKPKLTKLLFFSVLSVAANIWLLIYRPISNHFIYVNPYIMDAISISGILLGSAAFFVSINRILDKKPGLVIDGTGILDNSSAITVGRVLWSDITVITERTVLNQKMITIFLKKPEDYINNEINFIKRRMFKMNFKTTGSPISISPNSLKISLDELGKILMQKHSEYLNLIK